MTNAIELNGEDLTPDHLVAIACGAEVTLCPLTLSRMPETHGQLQAAIQSQALMYGVTTGLGPRAVVGLSEEEQSDMSLKTIRGRAHSVGSPLPVGTVRAAMAVRANTLMKGAAGAHPALPVHYVKMLNAGLTPVVGETGSVGAADLMWGASIALGLIGEGEVDTPNGRSAAAEALAAAGLKPYRPGPREGLAMTSHSSMVAAISALSLSRAETVFETAQTAAALSLEGFRGNISPLRFRALALRPQPGQMAAAAGIAARLDESPLHEQGSARRVQDPLSLRNVAQIHGTVVAALDIVDTAVRDEINGASDNPVVLAKTGEVVSSGGYLTPHLTVALGMLAQAFVHMSAAQVARCSKLVNPRFTDLPLGLVQGDTASAGMAPVMKSAEALFSEIMQLAQPAPVYPGGGADGVEDVVTHSAVAAKAMGQIVDRLQRLSAIELMLGAQAVELRQDVDIAPAIRRTVDMIRGVVDRMADDRPMTEDIEALTKSVAQGDFAEP
ncbi:MAG: aromatic amino acid lyase [Pseudomonadota bacterium]